jgi:hypothetical protein
VGAAIVQGADSARPGAKKDDVPAAQADADGPATEELGRQHRVPMLEDRHELALHGGRGSAAVAWSLTGPLPAEPFPQSYPNAACETTVANKLRLI